MVAPKQKTSGSPPESKRAKNDEALIDIKTLEILEGGLPKRAKTLAIEWAIEHRDELMTNWQKARSHESLDKIQPLD